MKVKTAELSGVQLDYAVALVLGEDITVHAPSQRRFDIRGGIHCSTDGCTYGPRSSCHDVEEYSPSTDWSQCGPLIEQYKLSLYLHSEYEINGEGVYDVYEAGCSADWFVDATTPDPVSTDPKVAICRAVVASKLGDEVDIPDELMESQQ